MSVRLLFSRRVRGRIIRDLDRLYNVVSNLNLLYKVWGSKPFTIVNVGDIQVQRNPHSVSAFTTGEFISRSRARVSYYKYSLGVKIDFKELEDVKIEDKGIALKHFINYIFHVTRGLFEGRELNEILSSEVGEILESEVKVEREWPEVKDRVVYYFLKCDMRGLGAKGYINVTFNEKFLRLGRGYLIVYIPEITELYLTIDRRILSESETWVMKPELLRFNLNPKVRDRVIRHVKNICRIASKPEIWERVARLEGEWEAPPLSKVKYYDEYIGRDCIGISGYALYKGGDRGGGLEVWYGYVRVVGDEIEPKVLLDLSGVFYKDSLSEKGRKYLPKIGSILDSMAKFTEELLSGKTLGEVGNVVERYKKGEFEAIFRPIIREFIVWKIINGNLIVACFDEFAIKGEPYYFSSENQEGSYSYIVVLYPIWQDEDEYRGLSQEDLARIFSAVRDPCPTYTQFDVYEDLDHFRLKINAYWKAWEEED